MKKLNLVTYVNAEFEDEKALVLKIGSETKVLVKGDYYHNKIEERIGGFLDGLNFAGVEYGFDSSDIYINHKDKLYSVIGFERQDFDDEDDCE